MKQLLTLFFISIFLISSVSAASIVSYPVSCDSSGCGGIAYHCYDTNICPAVPGDGRYKLDECGGNCGEQQRQECIPACAEAGCSCYNTGTVDTPSCSVNCVWGDWGACSGTFDSATQSRSQYDANSCGTCSGSESRACSLLNSAVWADLAGNIITSSNFQDSVFMKINGLGLKNQNINYTINIKEGSIWKSFLEFLGLIEGEYTSTAQTSNSIYTVINDSEHIYHAQTNNNNGLTQADSEPLSISAQDNSKPVVIINSPTNRMKTSVNYNTSFTQSSYDRDDLLRLNWNFGDNSNQVISNYAKAVDPTLGNINHSYNESGLKIVTLNASEMTRSQSNATSIVIEVLKPGINTIAVISSPQPDLVYNQWVNFSANSSYVANCSLTPDYGSGSDTFLAGNLYCKYIHAPGTNVITGNYNLMLNWTVYEQDSRGITIMSEGFPITGLWNSTSEFRAFFDSPKKRQAVLSITYLG